METRLFILLLLTGVVSLVPPGPRKNYLIKEGKTWNNAQTFCRTKHTDLATVESAEDLIKLQNLAKENQFSFHAWIGMYNDINSWRWSLNDTALGGMRKWYWYEPDNWGGHQKCGFVHPWGWFDYACSYPLQFICYDENKTGNARYILYSTPKSWYEAQQYCRENHTDLASARDETENSLLQSMTLYTWSTWFGLFRESWKWSDQTNYSKSIWMPGCPNNYWGAENCAYLYYLKGVDDAQCSAVLPFFCYRVITGQQQILRMKVQSDQDVNDPAVSAAILEKIQQKLKELGVAGNFTVKWREQPDNNVFHKMEENKTLVEYTSRNTSDLNLNVTLY